MPDSAELLPPTVHDDADDISLLELLAIVAENLKLLILGPLVAGLVALGVAYVWPPTYESVSVLQTGKIKPQVVSGAVRSADVLEAVAKDLGLEQHTSGSQRLERMQRRVNAVVGRQDDLVTLTTRAPTAEEAQRLNEAVLVRTYPFTVPTGVDAARIQTQLKALQEALAASGVLERSAAQQLQAGQISDGAARLYAELQNTNGQRALQIADLQSQLLGLTKDNLIQQPTLPDKPAKPKKALVAVVAALAVGMLLLFFVFVRQGLRGARDDAQQADALRRLRAALGLKS